MVNRGQPSRDCFPCRKRKLRCDLQPEGCGQCQRAKLLCHGFRDLKELVFRDETQATREKVLARRMPCFNPEPRSLQLQWNTRSRHAFFALYVAGLSRSHDTLGDLYKCTSSDDALSASIDAASLAFMSNELTSPEILKLAREQYTIALRRLAQALRNPQSMKKDETLQSVLLLDLYEKMTHPDPQASSSWMSHILGAMSLINSRSKSNRLGPTARRLAMRVVTSLSISCGAAHSPIPGELRSLQANCGFVPSDAAFDFTAILVDVVSLRHRPISAAEKAKRAQEIDHQLARLESAMDRQDILHIYVNGAHQHVLEDYYDYYPNYFIAQVWNGIRMIRLEMNSLILSNASDHELNIRISATRTIDILARQVCATVPQLILPEARSSNRVPFSPLQRLQCRTMLPPLYLAHQASGDTSLQGWIRRVMAHIAEAGNMKIAKDILGVLKAKPNTDYWKVYAMTGCYSLAA